MTTEELQDKYLSFMHKWSHYKEQDLNREQLKDYKKDREDMRAIAKELDLRIKR